MILTKDAVTVDALTAADWPAVSAIYAEGIATRNATFETHVPSWEEWAWVHMCNPCLVAKLDGEIVGWAALSHTSNREVYKGVLEVSIYVAERARGNGVGTRLLRTLIEQAEAEDAWTIEAGIFPENTASIALHERCGFRVVGTRERLGKMDDGTWRDVVLMERRSRRVT